jgi:stringent starvation protein B
MVVKQEKEASSTRPYLIRALHEWCSDNGLTPYVTVAVDGSVQVPLEYVKDGEIVLNIGMDATTALRMGNDYLEFKARFSGAVREIIVPMEQVVAIFARENGQGMAFPKPDRPALIRSASNPNVRGAIKLADTAKTGPEVPSPAETENAHVTTRVSVQKSKPVKSSPKPTLTRIK